MGLSIPDNELRTISGEVLDIPNQITNLNNQLVTINVAKDDTEDKDDGNKVFFDFFLAAIISYHAEKQHINSIVHTDYSETTLIDSAQQKPGNLHYPESPIWVNLSPKALPENNGDPTSNIALYETDQLSKIPPVIDTIRNGFTDGAITDALTVAYSVGTDIEVDAGGFAIGQRIVIDDLGVSLLAEITDVKPPSTTGAEDLELNVLAAALGPIGVGGQVRNFHPGWSNAEREETVALNEPEVLHYFESLIDPEISSWETTLDNQLAALSTSEPGTPEEPQRDAAILAVNNAKGDIDTWQAAPATGAGVGRYGDTVLAPLEARVTTRGTETVNRINQINLALGALSQNPDGTFSGSGHYHTLFKWIDIRIKKGSGTLFNFYNFDVAVGFINSQIDTLNNKKAEYDNAILVKAITADVIGSVFVPVADITGLSISDTVKVVSDDDGEPVVTGNIVDIQGLILELDTPVITALVEQRGRVAKELL